MLSQISLSVSICVVKMTCVCDHLVDGSNWRSRLGPFCSPTPRHQKKDKAAADTVHTGVSLLSERKLKLLLQFKCANILFSSSCSRRPCRKVWRRGSCWSKRAPSSGGRGGTSNSEAGRSTTPKTARCEGVRRPATVHSTSLCLLGCKVKSWSDIFFVKFAVSYFWWSGPIGCKCGRDQH